MFSKGLPSPFAGRSVSLEPPADDDGALCVEDATSVRAGLFVELAANSRVEVMTLPVLTPVGPTTMGTMTCSVFPALSVVVLVMVDLIVLVRSCPSSLPGVVWCSLSFDLVEVWVGAVVCGGTAVAVAAADALSITWSGMGQSIAAQ